MHFSLTTNLTVDSDKVHKGVKLWPKPFREQAAGAYENHDFYQVISYATGLSCPRTHLIYPATEQERNETIGIRETNITVGVHRIDLEDPKCVENAEKVAESVLRQYPTKLPN